ncbi:hypothetical protein QTH89_05190 [Variovorax sp. J22G21]|uniref:hypothetical protein n=1 Tax=Variovorax fucosicus TaxID=3053517 RepID=UPI002574D98E|nr:MULTISPECIES: hypothetical protein [unclassified Variovorax]MDM0041540.1 hypothetical protein [Variovorax sp. J22R193]MDM0060596.1 hypothetical protein [Variovorax sp. J22G21]
MRVLYSGGTICSFETLQRLVLLADEIAFMDRPSVKVGNFGTVGRDSEFRRFQIEAAPVKFSVHAPPEGQRRDLYLRYVETDLRDANFLRIVLDGLKADVTFQQRLVQLEANYGWGTGRQVLDELVKDAALYEGKYGAPTEPKLLYVPDTAEGRRQTFATLLIEASIQVTNALIVAEATGLSPVADDPYFCRLIALRASDAAYVSQPAATASLLGLAITKSVLPDETLARLKMKDLFEYRTTAKEAYGSWSLEVERLAQKLVDVPIERFGAEAARLIVSEVRPRMLELRSEMACARDKLFGDLLKTVTKWEVPTMSLAYFSSLSLPTALAAFAGALAPAVPSVVDYYVQRRNLARKNSMAYLVGVSKVLDDERS